MLPAHFHDVNGDISDHNVVKTFGLYKILSTNSLHRALIVI